MQVRRNQRAGAIFGTGKCRWAEPPEKSLVMVECLRSQSERELCRGTSTAIGGTRTGKTEPQVENKLGCAAPQLGYKSKLTYSEAGGF